MTPVAIPRPHGSAMNLTRSQAHRETERKEIIAAVYVRVSTREQATASYSSLDTQESICRDAIRTRETQGWRIYPEVFSDPGISGSTMERPGLRRLLSLVQAGQIQAIVMYRIDRISRKLRDILAIKDLLERNGGSLVSATEAYDTTTTNGRLHFHMMASMGEWERETIVERTWVGVHKRMELGKYIGSPQILGYNLVDKRLVVNPQEAEQVKATFETYARLRSLSQTATWLNAQGYRSKVYTNKQGIRKGGKVFTKTNLAYLLRNPTYVGFRWNDQALVKGEQDGILKPGLFERVQALLKANGTAKKSLSQNKHGALLKGLVRCAVCGSAMTPSHSRGRSSSYRYYRCTSVNNMDRTGCMVRAVSAEVLEGHVVGRLRELGRSGELVERVIRSAQDASEAALPPLRAHQAQLQGELRRIEEEANRLLQALTSAPTGDKNNGFVLRKLGELEEQRKDATSRQEALDREIKALEARAIKPEEVRRTFEAFSQVFDELTLEERQELIRLLVKEIVYDGIASKVRLVLRHVPPLAAVLSAEPMNPDTNCLYQSTGDLPVSDTGKNGRGLLWRLVPEDYPDAFPDRFQVETACRLGERKRDPGLPAEASAQAGGHLEPFPHDLRPAELYALVGRTA